ncbi:MAG: SH3 domain-containing protein [Lachnospiraceae bacterium]|nr:SH3 domain-containing protein [Lachnospiraceae bacterium]
MRGGYFMATNKSMFAGLAGVLIMGTLLWNADITVEATGNYLDTVNGGVASILDPGAKDSTEAINKTAKALKLDLTKIETEEQESSTLVMANVKQALNVRENPDSDAEKVGMLYKDCGGTILERQDGWTKIQSGNLIGWANDKYLLFGEDAEALADDVGMTTAHIETETLRVRSEASTESSILGLLPKGDVVEVIDNSNEEWVLVDYEGSEGYVSREFVKTDFVIDAGETLEEIKARLAAEAEAKRHVNYGAYTTDADTTLLLAALIQCEAGGESYEGQVAVGAVVMNRVRSSAYPDSIHGVIYASGQFTPAQNGKVNRVYESGKIKQSCIDAANEAISGTSNVGSYTHFRRNNGREGLVIGNHVFY